MKRRNFFNSSLFYILVFLGIIGIAQVFSSNRATESTESITSTEFVQYLEDDRVEQYSIQPTAGVYEIRGTFRQGEEIETDTEEENNIPFFGQQENTETRGFTTILLRNDAVINDVYQITRNNDVTMNSLEEPSTGIWTSLLITFLPFLLLAGFLYFMMNQAGQGGSGGGGGRNVMNFGRSQAKEADAKTSTVRFADVAGADEEKQELVEIVEFLKDPRRFNQLGARIPAGVLLEGPPGTGKTLLARAVAGESGVPFYSISGSEFVEMFVGVGASRVRDLFENAKKNAPSIIFIDEIDAVGRQRGAGMGGGHDEREQTLNQLLTEMDGFEGNEGVIVMAATNRSDVLDPALLRPGRFDRRILVGRPDVKGREAILKVHARNKPLSDEVNLKLIARQTPGFSGADLENLLNEAALVAARRESTIIEPIDMDEAHDRVIAGPAKKDRIMNETERKMVAYHEAGHTIVGLVLSDARIVHKVTIVPRGRAGGYAIMLPKEDRYLMTKKDLTEQIVGLLGGRAAEEIFFGTQSSGASNDFQQSTQIARSMVTEYGMSDKLGPVQYEGSSQVFLGRDYSQSKSYSEQIAYEIDQEVLRILNESHDEAVHIIEENATKLKLIAEHLLEYETLNELEIKSLYEDGVLPSRDPETHEYPREEETDEDQTGTSYEEIKKAHEERVRAIEEQHQEQKEGRRTIGLDDSDSVDEEDETKVEMDPEDVDPKELEAEAKEEDSDESDTHSDSNTDSEDTEEDEEDNNQSN
ncbi:MAG TPA: ATP-dependent zinc metalloprotease FtsH [Atopostipes sp.]|nr:ATP-dependent zinc metalloprotease FtsH [Atopostipes sp.]